MNCHMTATTVTDSTLEEIDDLVDTRSAHTAGSRPATVPAPLPPKFSSEAKNSASATTGSGDRDHQIQVVSRASQNIESCDSRLKFAAPTKFMLGE